MKNKVIGLMALASCVMLSGCGKGSKDIKIEIADFPTDLVAGSKIDLKNYIIVSGGEGGYSINFDDENFAKVTKESETEFILNQYGAVTFTVEYSGKTMEATISVGSELLNKFLKDTKDVGYAYADLRFDDYGYVESWNNYGKDYLINYFYSDETAGGYYRDNGSVYTFEINDKHGLDFYVTGNEPYGSEFDMFVAPLELPTTGYDVKTEEYKGETYEALRFEENANKDVEKLFANFFLYDVDLMKKYGLIPSAIEITEDYIPLGDGLEMPLYDIYGMIEVKDKSSEYYGEEVMLDLVSISVDSDFFFNEDVENFIKSGKKPSSKYSLNVDEIAAAVNTHDFTVNYSSNWYEAAPNAAGTELVRGDAVNANPFVEDPSKAGTYIHDFMNAIGETKAYVTPDKTYFDVTHGPDYGLVNHDNGESITAWEYQYKEDSSAYNATTDTGFGLFHEANTATFMNYQFLANEELDEIGTIYDEMFINSVDESGSTVTYSLSGVTSSFAFFTLFYASIIDGAMPGEGDYDVAKYNTLPAVSLFLLEQGMTDYMELNIIEKYAGKSLESVMFEYVWTDANVVQTVAGETYEYYQYVMSAEVVFGVGTTEMPTFDVEFPTL